MRIGILGSATVGTTLAAGAANLAGKPLIDATNPIADAPPVNGVLRFFTSERTGNTALMGLLAAVEGLADSFHRQPSRKAVGVDGIDKVDYGRKLEANLDDLSARLKRMGYRPKPSRRVYIPKSNGGSRPLGGAFDHPTIGAPLLTKRETGAVSEPVWNRRAYGSSVVKCMLWCIPGFRHNQWTHAFKLLKS